LQDKWVEKIIDFTVYFEILHSILGFDF